MEVLLELLEPRRFVLLIKCTNPATIIGIYNPKEKNEKVLLYKFGKQHLLKLQYHQWQDWA